MSATEFRWHLISDERPPEGDGEYILLGRRGGKYYANEYTSRSSGGGYFYVPNRRNQYMHAESIMAWAEIPPFEPPTRRD